MKNAAEQYYTKNELQGIQAYIFFFQIQISSVNC
jgi:hypothetical protein